MRVLALIVLGLAASPSAARPKPFPGTRGAWKGTSDLPRRPDSPGQAVLPPVLVRAGAKPSALEARAGHRGRTPRDTLLVSSKTPDCARRSCRPRFVGRRALREAWQEQCVGRSSASFTSAT